MTSPSDTPNSLIKRPSSDTSLMPPPPPPKRIKRPPKVLDEDDYTDALSHIIARDFFPGLLETRTQREYLDALASRDREWIASAGRRLEEVMTPGRSTRSGRRGVGVGMTPVYTPARDTTMTPRGNGATPREWAGDTPMSVVSSASTSASTTKPAVPGVEGMSLGAFQARYTSEDNESFNKLLDKQNEKKRKEYSWMWSGNKIPTPRQIAYRKREAKRLEAQKQNQKLIEDNDNDDDNSGKQLIVANPDDARPAKPDSWKSKPDNPLMFTPASIEDTHETVQQKAEAESRAGPKHVVYRNTRIQPVQSSTSTSTSTAIPPPSPSISAIRDAIAGRPRYTDTETGFAGGETPRVNGYAFVDEDEPEPEPQPTKENDESYRLSLLGTSSTTPNPFNLQETRQREALHHRMVDRVARTKRTEKLAQGIKTPVPRFASSPMMIGSTPRPGAGGGSVRSGPSLTPAAQRLWANVGTPRRSAGAKAGGGLRNMWTPTPKRTK